MTLRVGVVTFPGSLDDGDATRAVRLAGAEPVRLWHAARDVRDVDAVILPGGFSYGDYLRAGAIARLSPVVRAVAEAASGGLPVLGICNGFQILCEAGLLPGALVRNAQRRFVCRPQGLAVEQPETAWTSEFAAGEQITIPVKNGEGRYVAEPAVLDDLERAGRVVLRYTGSNPSGAERGIAGVANAAGNVVGMMPHPEHAVDPLTGSGLDGLRVFRSLVASLAVA